MAIQAPANTHEKAARARLRPCRWLCERFLTPFAAAFLLITVVSFTGGVVPAFDLFAHFRPQLAAGGAVLGGLLVFWRKRLLVALVVAGSLAHAAPLVPYVLAGPTRPACATGTSFRLVSINLHHRHARLGAVKDLILTERPDILLLTEYLPEHVAELQEMGDLFPFSKQADRDGSHEVLLLSRYVLRDAVFHRPLRAAPFFPVLNASICPATEVDTGCFTLIATHAARPMTGDDKWQKAGLSLAAELSAQAGGGRVVMAGDLNTTPWSARFSALTEIGGLRDSALGRGLQSSWLARSVLLGLPIDHILVGEGIAVTARRTGDYVGSDHFPVIADLAVCK